MLFRSLWEGWSPFREFGGLSSRMARMMDEMFGARARPGRLVPALDVAEDDGHYVVTVELPGTKREDVTVECEGADKPVLVAEWLNRRQN